MNVGTRCATCIPGDDKVAVTFMEFVPPKPLELKAGTVDIALLQPSAATDMGKKLYRLIFREDGACSEASGPILGIYRLI